MSPTLTPPPLLAGGTGIDEVIYTVASQLSVIDWLDYSLGRVMPQPQPNGLPRPWIYSAKGEYYEAYPNDRINSFSCLYAHDDEIRIDEFIGVRTLSVIVCANIKALQLMPPTVETLKQDVMIELMNLACINTINRSFDQSAGGVGGIYRDFDISGFNTKFLAYPYGAFRIETTVSYFKDC